MISIADGIEMKEQFRTALPRHAAHQLQQCDPMEIKRAVKYLSYKEYEKSCE